MRVLLTSHLPLGDFPEGGLYDLAIGLRRAGHEVWCLTVEDASAGEEPAEFPVERLHCGEPGGELPFGVPRLERHARGGPAFDELSDAQIDAYRGALRRRLDRCVEAFDPHLIHCQEAWLLGHLALETGVPYVVSLRGPEIALLAKQPRFQSYVEQGLENAGRVLAESRFLRDRLIDAVEAARENTQLVPTPIDLEPFQHPAAAALPLPAAAPRVAVAAELLPEDGIETVINAAAVLSAQGHPAWFAMCGDGPERTLLANQAQRQAVQNLSVLGPLGRAQRAALFASAAVVVVPSMRGCRVREAVEAMAAGTPVIASRIGALPEVVGDTVGGLVEPGDHELLAEMLLAALEGDWKASKGGRAAGWAAEHYALERSVARHVEIYQSVLVQRFGQARE